MSVCLNELNQHVSQFFSLESIGIVEKLPEILSFKDYSKSIRFNGV